MSFQSHCLYLACVWKLTAAKEWHRVQPFSPLPLFCQRRWGRPTWDRDALLWFHTAGCTSWWNLQPQMIHQYVANFCGFTICWLRLVKLATKHNSSDCCTLLWFTICWLPLIKPATTTFFLSSDSCTLLWFYNTPVMLHETHNLRQLIRLLHASVA